MRRAFSFLFFLAVASFASASVAAAAEDPRLVAAYAQQVGRQPVPDSIDPLLAAKAELEELRAHADPQAGAEVLEQEAAVARIAEDWGVGEVIGEPARRHGGTLGGAIDHEIAAEKQPGTERIAERRARRMRALGFVEVDTGGRTLRNAGAAPIERAHVTILLGDREGLACDFGATSNDAAPVRAGERAALRCVAASEGERMAAFKALWAVDRVVKFPAAVTTSAQFAPWHIVITPSGGRYEVDRASARGRVEAGLREMERKHRAARVAAAGERWQAFRGFLGGMGIDGWWLLGAMSGFIVTIGALVGFAAGWLARRPAVATLGVGLVASTAVLLAWMAFAFRLANGPRGGIEPGMYAVVASILAAGQLVIVAAGLGIFLAALVVGAMVGARWSRRHSPPRAAGGR